MPRSAVPSSHRRGYGRFGPLAPDNDGTNDILSPADVGASKWRDVDDVLGGGVTNYWRLADGTYIDVDHRFERDEQGDSTAASGVAGQWRYLGDSMATLSGYVRVLPDTSNNANDTGGAAFKDSIEMPVRVSGTRKYTVTLDAERWQGEVLLNDAWCYLDPPESGEPTRDVNGAKTILSTEPTVFDLVP